jgi:hypothetical protein
MDTARTWILGWLPLSVWEVVNSHTKIISRFAFCIISSIDSSKDMHDIKQANEIVQTHDDCVFFETGLLVPSALLPTLNKEFSLFHHFDELWFFDTHPRANLSRKPPIVAPVNLGADDTPKHLIPWMSESRCKLGIGDGDWLNFITSEMDTARLLQLASQGPDSNEMPHKS